jgi:tyrosine-protein kinase
MVTSSVDDEGKSTTVANLAVALARNGDRVALVDLDLRRPSLGGFFDVPRNAPGLTQVAIGETTLEDVLVPVHLYDAADSEGRADEVAGRTRAAGAEGELQLLPAGPSPPNPGEFIGSHALERILLQLQTQFDRVVIDAPPALRVADAMTLSARVDAMVVVTRMNIVRRPMLNELRRLLDAAPAAKLGFIVTGVTADEAYGIGYGYGYGYAYPVEKSFLKAE